MADYYILLFGIAIASGLVSQRLKYKFSKYGKIRLANGMSGAEIAQKMLDDHGIRDVKVISTPGMLTDHYNPKNKTVNLSEGVYSQRSASAAAVAAHEVGHAVQHAKSYSWLQMRSQMVPVVSLASGLSTWIIFAGIILMASGGGQIGFLISIIGLLLMAMATAFSFVTLPVEYDASQRALLWLENANMLEQSELKMAKDALKWAARTYVVAALGALASLLYWAIQILGSRD
jgi:hypothetical protein